jgi:glutathione S-transferase
MPSSRMHVACWECRRTDEAASFADMQRKVPKSVGACYDMIEAHMLRGPWATADAYTIADRLTHSGR